MVYSENKRDLITDGDLNFIIKLKADSSTAFMTTPIGPKGDFSLDSMIFRDTASIYFNYNTKKKSKKQVYLKLDQDGQFIASQPTMEEMKLVPVPEKVSEAIITKMVKRNEQMESFNEFQTRVIALKEVKVNVRRKSPTQLVNERYATSIFATPNANKTIDLITNPIPNISNLIVFLRSQIPGIDIVGPPGNERIVSTFGGISLTQGKQQVTIYLDQYETEFNSLEFIPVGDIALVKFVSNFVGTASNGPALLIFRKNPGDMGSSPSNYISSFKFPGYSVTKEFYQPNYTNPENMNSPDIRTTLYWNSDIMLDGAKQTEKMIFYNSDDCHKMRVIVEGFNKAGKLCHIEKILE